MLLAILLEMAAALPAWSQAGQKLPPSRSEYDRWGNLRLDKISDDGRHISFKMSYADGKDTLFLKDLKNEKLLSFAGGKNGIFTPEGSFIFQGPGSVLHSLSLREGRLWHANDVSGYNYFEKDDLLAYTASENGRSYLCLRMLKGGEDVKIRDVTEHKYNEQSGMLLCARKWDNSSELLVIHVRDKMRQTVLVPQTYREITNLTWAPDGSSIAFLQTQMTTEPVAVLKSYLFATGKLVTFDPETESNFPAGWSISTENSPYLKVAQGGERIFFKIYHDDNMPASPDKVQIWNAADKYLYPVRRRADGGVKDAKLAVWCPLNGRYDVINDNLQSETMLAGNDRYAILSGSEQYEPQWNYDALRDFYIEDLQTGEKKLLLERQSIEWGHISLSPDSWYIGYFNKGDWWLYDIRAGRRINMTKSLGSEFVRDDMDVTSGMVAWGMGGWTDGSRSVLLYDKHDVWIYETKNGKARKLTTGKEQELVYRAALPQLGTGYISNYDGQTARLHKGDEIFLEIHGRGQSGYCLLSLRNGCISRVIKSKKITGMAKGADSPDIVFIEEDFDMPPAIMVCKGSKINRAFQSNRQHFSYSWGKSELITYRNSKGRQLDAALYYPAGYKPGIKYPMVVYIYDRHSNKIHNYLAPSMQNSNGFNVTNFTLEGYFVLVPDIAYEVGSPGYSASDCVISVTKEVVSKGYVDSGKIGLVGHSFGGYETDFIITQTNLFAAAVSGAAITDLPSSYLYASWNYAKPNFWHYEYNQLRMGGSLFDNFLGYVSNSPVYHADKVITPLLSWTGENDKQVYYYQSIEFYLAMRRLGKKHIMLIYPGQGHALSDEMAQGDLTEKIEEWFGYYLKSDTLPKWTKADLPR